MLVKCFDFFIKNYSKFKQTNDATPRLHTATAPNVHVLSFNTACSVKKASIYEPNIMYMITVYCYILASYLSIGVLIQIPLSLDLTGI